MATPLAAALEHVVSVLEATEPAGGRPTLRYRLAEYLAIPDPENETGNALEDRSFAFGDPVGDEYEGTAGISLRLRPYLVPVVLYLATAELGSLIRTALIGEHSATWARALDAVSTWPQGVLEVVTLPSEPRVTDTGDTLLVTTLRVVVWET